MELQALKDEITLEQKKGLPFIYASVVIWLLIAFVAAMDLPITTKNLWVFVCSVPLMPIAWLSGKILKVNLFNSENPLGQLGFLFTLNQMLYLLIVMWVFNAVPDKMIMVYGMVFGAHLLPYSWLYQSMAYRVFSILIPFVALWLGLTMNGLAVALVIAGIEIFFCMALHWELAHFSQA